MGGSRGSVPKGPDTPSPTPPPPKKKKKKKSQVSISFLKNAGMEPLPHSRSYWFPRLCKLSLQLKKNEEKN